MRAKSRLLRIEFESGAVDAVAKAGRVRAIGEDVPEVGFTARTANLGPPHEVRVVLNLFESVVPGGLVEARPAAARVIFGVGGEEWLSAADAVEHACTLLAVIGMREGALGAVLARDVILLGRQLALPLGLRLFDFGLGVVGRHGASAIREECI